MTDADRSFRIIAVENIIFNLHADLDPATFQPGILDYAIEQEHRLNTEDQLLFFNTTVTIRLKGSEKELAHFKGVTIFELYGPEAYSHPEANSHPEVPSLPHTMNENMSRIAIGAARGLLASKLKDSYLSNAVLPLLPFEY